jgi:glycosyltransferase involved in cell wall biosynthesis
MTPKVTIITITYNAGRFLKNTIDSILGQTNTEFEYLIVDGGSKDDTLDIIRQYPNRQYASFEEACGREGAADGLIHWISEPDKGLYDAMNKGIRLAKGSFVWFVNAGDKIYDSNTLKAVVDTIDQNPECDVVYGQAIIIDENEKVVGERHKIAPANLTLRSLLYGSVVCHQSILVRTAIAPFYDTQYRISADYDWLCNVMERSGKNCYIDNYLSRFMTEGVSTQQRKKALLERYQIMKNHFGFPATLWAHLKIVVKYLF